ncbi:MAG: helix-hairpin-helix domain-containing protein [Verrucomicrobiota bacterium]
MESAPATPQPAAQAEPELAPAPGAEAKDDGKDEKDETAPVAFNLNTCTVEDLVNNIPDCTPALAAAILAYRDKIGAFSGSRNCSTSRA